LLLFSIKNNTRQVETTCSSCKPHVSSSSVLNIQKSRYLNTQENHIQMLTQRKWKKSNATCWILFTENQYI